MIACHSLISWTTSFSCFGGDTILIHRSMRWYQVGRAVPREIECLGLRLEGLPVLVLGYKSQLAFRELGDAHDVWGEHTAGK